MTDRLEELKKKLRYQREELGFGDLPREMRFTPDDWDWVLAEFTKTRGELLECRTALREQGQYAARLEREKEEILGHLKMCAEGYSAPEFTLRHIARVLKMEGRDVINEMWATRNDLERQLAVSSDLNVRNAGQITGLRKQLAEAREEFDHQHESYEEICRQLNEARERAKYFEDGCEIFDRTLKALRAKLSGEAEKHFRAGFADGVFHYASRLPESREFESHAGERWRSYQRMEESRRLDEQQEPISDAPDEGCQLPATAAASSGGDGRERTAPSRTISDHEFPAEVAAPETEEPEWKHIFGQGFESITFAIVDPEQPSAPTRLRARVYVAGPYTKPDPEANVTQAVEFADELADRGFAPFVPHLFHFWHEHHPRPYQFWMALDFEFVRTCDAVFRMPGESPGADQEVALAHSLGIPVFASIEELDQHFGKVSGVAPKPPLGDASWDEFVKYHREFMAWLKTKIEQPSGAYPEFDPEKHVIIPDRLYFCLRDWWRAPDRKPAALAFTTGLERTVATLIEEIAAGVWKPQQPTGDAAKLFGMPIEARDKVKDGDAVFVNQEKAEVLGSITGDAAGGASVTLTDEYGRNLSPINTTIAEGAAGGEELKPYPWWSSVSPCWYSEAEVRERERKAFVSGFCCGVQDYGRPGQKLFEVAESGERRWERAHPDLKRTEGGKA